MLIRDHAVSFGWYIFVIDKIDPSSQFHKLGLCCHYFHQRLVVRFDCIADSLLETFEWLLYFRSDLCERIHCVLDVCIMDICLELEVPWDKVSKCIETDTEYHHRESPHNLQTNF